GGQGVGHQVVVGAGAAHVRPPGRVAHLLGHGRQEVRRAGRPGAVGGVVEAVGRGQRRGVVAEHPAVVGGASPWEAQTAYATPPARTRADRWFSRRALKGTAPSLPPSPVPSTVGPLL